MEYLNYINEFTLEVLLANDKFVINDIRTGAGVTLNNKNLDSKLLEFYNTVNGFLFKWDTINDSDNSGFINILEADKAFIEGKDIVYFDHTPEDSPMRDFYIIDFFVDEACVGVYANQSELPGMHYFDFENETYPLHVDFEGYIKLLGETKGFLYWQKVILDYLSGSESFETKNFKETIPNLFANFDYNAFIELYESVRIDK